MFDENFLTNLNPNVNQIEAQIKYLEQLKRNVPSRAKFEDIDLAKAFHENVTVKRYGGGMNCIYPLKRYANGTYGFFFKEPTSLADRQLLLEKYFRQHYLDESGKKVSYLRLCENIKVSRFNYAPYQPFFYTDQSTGYSYVNTWQAPYWWKVKNGLISEPHRQQPKGELPLFLRKLFCHLFNDNLAKLWVKNTLLMRETRALVLIAESRTGKSAFMQMIASLHEFNHHTAYTLKKFAEGRFALGPLANTTFVGINEGVIKKDYFELIKTFLNSPTIDAEIKYERNGEVTNYNSMMIASDRMDAVQGSDQALLNRMIIPHMNNRVLEAGTPVVMEDGTTSYFTEEEIIRVYNMSSKQNKQMAELDILALSEHLEVFEDKSIEINSNKVTGYQNKDAASSNFLENLKPWQTAFVNIYLLPKARTCPIVKDRYQVDYEALKRLLVIANTDSIMRDLVKQATTNGYDKITENKLKELATQNAGVIRCVIGSKNTFRYEIDRALVEGSTEITVNQVEVKEAVVNHIQEPISVSEPIMKSEGKKSTTPEYGKFAFIDFEFHLHCKYPKLMACVLKIDNHPSKRYWLWQSEYTELKRQIISLKEQNYTFVSFTDAEARCFYQMTLDPLNFNWLDAQILGYPFYHSSKEFSSYATSSTLPDKPFFEEDMDEEEIVEHNDKSSRKKSASLLGFHKFFCNSNTDKEQANKDATRKLILSIKPNDIVGQVEKDQILEYCAQDVEILHELFHAQVNKWCEVSNKEQQDVIRRFSEFSMHRVRMLDVSYHGIPINAEVYDELCGTYQERVANEQAKMGNFYRYQEPEYYKKAPRIGQIKTPGKYVQDHTLLTQYIRNNNLLKVWPQTPSGKFSSDEETLQRFSSYPEINDYFMGRKRVKHIEFFKPDENMQPKISKFVTYENGHILQHPEYGTFATNTSRHGHKTSTFIMGMERSLRKELLGCPEGYVLLQPDYSAQEVWIAGAISGDKNQLKAAYTDPYIDAGIAANMIPVGGTKHTHAAERDIFKVIVLAGFYGMGQQLLQIKLKKSEKIVKELSEFIRNYYSTFYAWRTEFLKSHEKSKYYELADGWPLLDNVNAFGKYKTCPAMNFPIQGHGAVILRKVVELFYQYKPTNARMIYTLHDEFGIICRSDLENQIKDFMTQIMQDACRFYFPNVQPPKVGFK